MEKIESNQNPRIKHWKRLLSGKGRRQSQEFLIEGNYELVAAIKSEINLTSLLFCPDFLPHDTNDALNSYFDRGITGIELSPSAFQKISLRQHPDGIIGVPSIQEKKLPPPPSEEALLLVINRLEKPGNLGALLRTAAAVGVTGVINCDAAVDFEHPQVIRASRGLVFSLPQWTLSVADALSYLENHHYRLLAADEKAEAVHWNCDWSGRIALLLGEEHAGLPHLWNKTQSLEKIRIPMRDGVDSLNVSVSGAILLYEWLRRRSSTHTTNPSKS